MFSPILLTARTWKNTFPLSLICLLNHVTKGQKFVKLRGSFKMLRIIRFIRLYRTYFRVMTFPRAGLKINLRRSGLVRAGTHRLVLAKVDRRAAGSYGCQVGRTMRDKTSVPKAEIMTDRPTGRPT